MTLQALSIVDGVIVVGLPHGGATLFQTSQMLSGAESNEGRSAALSRQLVSLIPTSQHQNSSLSFLEEHAGGMTNGSGGAQAWHRVSSRVNSTSALISKRAYIVG